MPRHLSLAVGLFLAGCGAGQITAVPVRETGVAASCAALSPAQQFAAAHLVFVGVTLPGPIARLGGRRVLGSPARMRVARYLKGHGPSRVTVETAVMIGTRGVTVAEDGIEPSPGQRWKIYANSRGQPFQTSVCAGSLRVAPSAELSPSGSDSVALLVWRTFPVDARPRPIVPLGEGIVLDPATGFHTDDQKVAYEEGRFSLRAALPEGSPTVRRFRVGSAQAAYRRLRAVGTTQHVTVPPLTVTAVKLGTAKFMTDRGRATLPAWQFSFKGVGEPASVLALASPDVFIPPPLHRFGPPGPGNSIEASAKMSPSGKAITISFIGAHAGTGPCDAGYRVSALTTRQAVAFTIETIPAPARRPAAMCAAIGYGRTAVLQLARPLGARVLVSAADAGAVAVRTRR